MINKHLGSEQVKPKTLEQLVEKAEMMLRAVVVMLKQKF